MREALRNPDKLGIIHARMTNKKYHIWTEGCQMNVADSQRVGSSLEHLGYIFTDHAEEADVIVLNTCVVRQSAEDKALGRLSSLLPLKRQNPDLVINLMGCLVGVRGAEKLHEKLPMVDVFSPPSDPGPLVSYLTQGEIRAIETDETTRRFEVMDGDLLLPLHERGQLVSAHVPIVYGCSHACTFCIIPYKRGVERSRPVGDIVGEIRSLAAQGVKEITLLGQIVDRYGVDIPDGPDLPALLRIVHDVDGIERIRFLTSHPNYFSEELMDTVAELPKVMPHIEVPIQAGDDGVLENMKRGYTQQEYRDLVTKIRERIPGCSIATDIIVGFPGETEKQFIETYRVLSDLKLDVAHLARYSSRDGTVATRRMDDDISDAEKRRRFHLLEDLQEKIVGEINAKLLGQTVEVLFEEKVKGRWKGRTPTNKLVFVESDDDLRGQVERVTITWTGPWSMQASLVRQPVISL
jgi:tRNA-2-methylthio-N6-dimethylallyladenosine synthase